MVSVVQGGGWWCRVVGTAEAVLYGELARGAGCGVSWLEVHCSVGSCVCRCCAVWTGCLMVQGSVGSWLVLLGSGVSWLVVLCSVEVCADGLSCGGLCCGAGQWGELAGAAR